MKTTEMKTRIGFEIEHTATCCGEPHVITKKQLPYPKAEPLWVGGAGNIQLDCTLLETAINPSEDPEQVWAWYEELMAESKRILPTDLVLSSAHSVMEYKREDLEASKDAMEIGCSAAFCAYDGVWGESVTPNEYEDNIRCAGVHVNIDLPKMTHDEVCKFVQTLDYLLGSHSVNEWEQDDKEAMIKRREVYGQAGNYRLTAFGVEYRTLPSLVWTKENVVKIYELVTEALQEPFKHLSHNMQNKINQCQGETA